MIVLIDSSYRSSWIRETHGSYVWHLHLAFYRSKRDEDQALPSRMTNSVLWVPAPAALVYPQPCTLSRFMGYDDMRSKQLGDPRAALRFAQRLCPHARMSGRRVGYELVEQDASASKVRCAF